MFTDSLNRTWSDLFVRLAPTEAFVPVFRVPEDDEDVVAVLETVHRDGSPGGPPAAMLSAGNLNTAALTLFLALNLSVEQRLPWLLLDDPVQSMDEIHVAQFAALLRTLTRDHGRRVIIAVHERALFEYLALELSPARPSDGLITVQLSRPPDGLPTSSRSTTSTSRTARSIPFELVGRGGIRTHPVMKSLPHLLTSRLMIEREDDAPIGQRHRRALAIGFNARPCTRPRIHPRKPLPPERPDT